MLTQLLEKAGDSLPASYRPFPPAEDRVFWDGAPTEIKDKYIKSAEEYMNFEFPVLKASDFMEYHRTGNRSGYQRLYGHRRHALNIAILAELFENKGRFIDLITDMVWLICEQTTWIIPAHNSIGGFKHRRFPLADHDHHIVDLMSADVAASISLAYYFFRNKFDEMTPQINSRIRYELKRRILKPYRNHTDYWWMGFMHVGNEQLNNWNPWINSNVLMILLIIEDNATERYHQLHKIMQSLDKYIGAYPDDGGCDEGPGYWGRAGASLFECLDLMYDFSGGIIDIFDDEKIRNMCRFIYRAHIEDTYFVNFADASASAVNAPALIYRFGKAIDDERCMAFGAQLYNSRASNDHVLGRFGIIRQIHEIEVYDELKNYDKPFKHEPSSYLPDIEVAFMRGENEKGRIFTAVKGGNNFENHNHNDIGNFIVYADGEPFIIDAGAMEYTRKTFSDQRYEIWTNCSRYHNVPEVNGFAQVCGREYRARNVSFSESEGGSSFTAELQDSYPGDSGIIRWKRTLSLDSCTAAISIDDVFKLKKVSDDIKIHLMALPKPSINGNRIILEQAGKKMEISFSENFEAEFETIQLDDEKHKSDWGKNLYRITLSAGKTVAEGICSMMIRLI